MTQHYYGDLSNLNAPYDVIPLQGYGLGADDPKFPWKKKSSDTLALQQDINEGLTSHGLCPIVEDGFLGPATCGAANYFVQQGVFPADVIPSTCGGYTAQWIAPKSKPCGSTKPAATAPTTTTPAATEASVVGGDGVPTWVWGLGLGAAAIALAMYLKKKKR